MTNDQLGTVRGEEELVRRAGHLFDAVETEFFCAARDLNIWDAPRARMALSSRLGPPGHAVRKLLSPVALTDENQRLHLRQVRKYGAQIRISAAPLPHETIILDRRVAILAGSDAAPVREFTITTAQAVVGSIVALFDAAWESATDYDAYLRGDAPVVDAEGRTILRALGSGATDETAARELGMSLRTYRRRVAELMIALEADSRFQAGQRAAEFGLTG